VNENNFAQVNKIDAIYLDGDFHKASKNVIFAVDSAINLDGNHGVLRGNKVLGADDGFFVDGYNVTHAAHLLPHSGF